MTLTAFAVRNWQLTLILGAVLAAIGISSFLTIPRSVDPHIPTPFVNIVAVQPGADAADMEQTIAKPIEETVQGLDDVDEISSTSSDGLTILTVQFDWGSDPEQKFNDVVREVTAIRDRLPEGLASLEFRKFRTTESSLVQYGLVSDTASWRRLGKYAEDLAEELVRVEGMRDADIYGLPEPEIRVAIDSGRLAEYRLPASAVTAAITRGGADLAAGAVHSGTRRFNVDAGGAYGSVAEVAAVPLRAAGGSLVSVGDVAEVGWAEDERLHVTRINGARGLVITAEQKEGENALPIKDRADIAVAAFEAALPPDMRLVPLFDQTEEIRYRLGILGRDFAIALSLVLLTLLPLGPRASLIVMMSIPLSLATGVLALDLLGHTLNQLAISGFILSLGLLVDDSIVVVENISRHLRAGARRAEAALGGTREITAAVLGATGVLIFAFVPMTALPGGAGEFTRSLPLAVIFTVLASLVISLTIIPFLASRLLKRDDNPEGNVFLRKLNAGIHRVYTPVLHRALEQPRRWFIGTMSLCLAALGLIRCSDSRCFPQRMFPFSRSR